MDSWCDHLVAKILKIRKTIGPARNKYGALCFFKWATDSFCTAARFGQCTACPICHDANSRFSVAHLSSCADMLTVCLMSIPEAHLLLIMDELDSLHDKRSWLRKLASDSLYKSCKLRTAVLSLFAVFGIICAQATSAPNLCIQDRISIVCQQTT